MLRRYVTRYCPVCDSALGTFDSKALAIVQCFEKDCYIKWAYKPGEEKPTALEWPGKKEPKICTCANCKSRTK